MPEKMDESTQTVLEAIEAAYNTGKGKPLDDRGRELLDPRPMAPPVGYKRQPSMVEYVRQMVRSEQLRAAAEAAEADTFEDADDFEIDDDLDPHTPYEAVFDPPPVDLTEVPPESQGTQPEAGEPAPPPAPGRGESGSKKPPAEAAGKPPSVHST